MYQVRQLETRAAIQAGRQQIRPALQQRLIAARGQHQQILAFQRFILVALDHTHTGSRQTGGVAETAEHIQVQGELFDTGSVRHDHGGFGQVGHTREGEAAALEHTQVGHGNEVLITTEVQRRICLDGAAHVVDDDVAAFTLLDVVVHEAQLQGRLQRQAVQRQQQLALLQQALIILQLCQQRLVVLQAFLRGQRQ